MGKYESRGAWPGGSELAVGIVVQHLDHEGLGVGGEGAIEFEVPGLAVVGLGDAVAGDLMDLRAGDGHQEGRMGGHDDLSAGLGCDAGQEAQEVELAAGGEGAFGLVEEIEALLGPALGEGAGEALAVAVGEDVGGDLAGVKGGLIDIAGDGEEGLGAEEPALGDLGQPGGAEGIGQGGAAFVQRPGVVDELG